MTQEQVADKMHQQRQVISYYETGSRTPNIEDLKEFALLYNTTTDYLLGLAKTESNKPNIPMICEYTGLTEESIEYLHDSKDQKMNFCIENCDEICNSVFFTTVINKMLSDKKFAEAIFEITSYKTNLQEAIKIQNKAKTVEVDSPCFSDSFFESIDTYKEARYCYYESLDLLRDCIIDIVNKELKEYKANEIILDKKIADYQAIPFDTSFTDEIFNTGDD